MIAASFDAYLPDSAMAEPKIVTPEEKYEFFKTIFQNKGGARDAIESSPTIAEMLKRITEEKDAARRKQMIDAMYVPGQLAVGNAPTPAGVIEQAGQNMKVVSKDVADQLVLQIIKHFLVTKAVPSAQAVSAASEYDRAMAIEVAKSAEVALELLSADRKPKLPADYASCLSDLKAFEREKDEMTKKINALEASKQHPNLPVETKEMLETARDDAIDQYRYLQNEIRYVEDDLEYYRVHNEAATKVLRSYASDSIIAFDQLCIDLKCNDETKATVEAFRTSVMEQTDLIIKNALKELGSTTVENITDEEYGADDTYADSDFEEDEY